jgi:serine-type D-Ala-D-Ala carboxypeptidase/endopeptidase (penicillin-binding protein 4)
MHARGCGNPWPLGGGALPRTACSADCASWRVRPAPPGFGARVRLPAVLALVLAASTVTCAQARWRHLAALERSGAAVSASAVDLGRGTVIEQLHAGASLRPASLTKLATAAAILDAWTPGTIFQTRLLARGRIAGDTLEGDLILEGAGDPSLDDHSLWVLAAQVRGAGISRVTGRLIVDPSPFGLVACGTLDRCAALHRSDSAYNAPIAAVGVDFGSWCVDVRPTRPGAPALVRGCGVARLPVSVDGAIRTTGARARQTFWIERVTQGGGDRLHVGGDIPMGDPQQVYRAMSDPARGAGLLLAETLREIGIRIDGPVVVRADSLPTDARDLAAVAGLPLNEQIGRMLRYSNNFMADVLSLDLAAADSARRPLTLADAGGMLAEFVSRIRRVGAASGRPILLSGSGLTPQNRLSASDLVALLAHEYRDTRHFPAFYGSLVVPRDAPFAFLRAGSAAWLDRIALKTGTMDNPVSVCGIAGYLRKRNGGWIAFSAIVNGTERRRHIPLDQALEAEEADVDALLARY